MKTFSKCVSILTLQSAYAFISNAPKTHQTCGISQLASQYGDSQQRDINTYDRYKMMNTLRKESLEDRLASVQTGRGPSPDSEFTPNIADQIFDRKPAVKVQGGSLKTWTFNSAAVEAVHVVIKTEGRPLDADIELWQGPDNTPCKMRVYIEDGSERPFSAMIATPRGPNTIALRNIGHLEFPFQAAVAADTPDIVAPSTSMGEFSTEPLIIQGGALRTYPFEPSVESIQVLINTDGRPLNARIELLQGPNNIKQVVELYTEDGMDRPFSMVIETPGSGNVVRIVNTATVEFPLTAGVDAYAFNNEYSDFEPVLGGDSNEGFMSSRR